MAPASKTRACKRQSPVRHAEADVGRRWNFEEVNVPCHSHLRRRLRLLGGSRLAGARILAQYRQRLGGGIDELKQVVARFKADARANGETPESAITRLRGNADDLASRQGSAMQGNVERLGRLEPTARQCSMRDPSAGSPSWCGTAMRT